MTWAAMSSMTLSICIPTHNGRRDELEELLSSLLVAIVQSGRLADVEICISDNASGDGTEAMVAEYMARYPALMRYHRNAENTGIRNFFTVVDMAGGDYVWMIGSDDAVLPTGVGQILDCLNAHPGLSGMTVNKLNFNSDLMALIGPDHDQVMPIDAQRSRQLTGSREILGNLFMSFLFISAHVFRKRNWDDVIEAWGIGKILTFEHFPHAFIYSEIAVRGGGWYWLADYCVIQRLENFSFWTEVSQRKLDYAEQHTADLARIADDLHGSQPDLHAGLMRRLFILYWNPICALQYVSDHHVSSTDIGRARQACASRFGVLPLFWMTTWPILRLPVFVSRPIATLALSSFRYLRKSNGLRPLRNVGRRLFHGILRLLRIENGTARSLFAEHEIARSFIASHGASRLSGLGKEGTARPSSPDHTPL